MKIELTSVGALFLIGTNLLARAAVQGVEQAFVSTAIEYASAGLMHASKQARASSKLWFH
jgi:hypothetical protein